jgi:hypothetical protein
MTIIYHKLQGKMHSGHPAKKRKSITPYRNHARTTTTTTKKILQCQSLSHAYAKLKNKEYHVHNSCWKW